MSRISAVVNKMIQINGEMIIVNYFVVLLDVLQTKKGTLGRDSSVSNPILFLKHNWNPKRQSIVFTIDVFIRELHKYWTLMKIVTNIVEETKDVINHVPA